MREGGIGLGGSIGVDEVWGGIPPGVRQGRGLGWDWKEYEGEKKIVFFFESSDYGLGKPGDGLLLNVGVGGIYFIILTYFNILFCFYKIFYLFFEVVLSPFWEGWDVDLINR